MNLEVKETGPVERRLRIELATADVDAAFDAVFQTYGRKARIPGFRKGKTPRSVLERYFGEDARSDVLRRLVEEFLPQAIKDAELVIMGEPRIEPAEHPKLGAPFRFEVVLEIRPEIELKTVRGLEVRAPAPPEPEQDPIEAHLEQLRVSQGQLVEESEGVVAAGGHAVVIDYEATVDGEPFDGGSGHEMAVEIGGGRSIPGFEDQLIGLRVADEKDFDLDLPESYPEHLAGKTASFHIVVLGLKRRELPELDDEFAKDVSDFESLAELRADLQQRVDEGREADRKRLLQEAVIDKLIEENPFPVPKGVVDRQLESRLVRAAGQLRGQVPDEKLGEMLEHWKEEWEPKAEREVRLALLIAEISNTEEITVTSEDVDAQLRQIAEQQGEPHSKLRSTYKERGWLGSVEDGLLERRVVEFLVAEATLLDS